MQRWVKCRFMALNNCFLVFRLFGFYLYFELQVYFMRFFFHNFVQTANDNYNT